MFARTQRLTLRPGWIEDAPALARAIAFPEVAFKLSRLPWPYAEQDAREWLARSADPRDVTLYILSHEAPYPSLVGAIGIHPAENGEGHELGYWLTPSAWGRGYATEAGLAMLGIARYAMGLKHLKSSHYVDNPASGRVLRKLGFRPTGHAAPQFCRALGESRPCRHLERDLTEGDMGDPGMDDPRAARLAA